MRGVLLAALLAGCAAFQPDDRPEPRPAAPVVWLRSYDQPYPEWIDGARGWEPLGFDVEFEDWGLPECPLNWFLVDMVDCQITIHMHTDPLTIEKWRADGVAFSTHRTIYLDDSVWMHGRVYVQHVSAHEVGHVLLMTGEHTERGLLSGAGTGDLEMSDDDRELACRAIGYCL